MAALPPRQSAEDLKQAIEANGVWATCCDRLMTDDPDGQGPDMRASEAKALLWECVRAAASQVPHFPKPDSGDYSAILPVSKRLAGRNAITIDVARDILDAAGQAWWEGVQVQVGGVAAGAGGVEGMVAQLMAQVQAQAEQVQALRQDLAGTQQQLVGTQQQLAGTQQQLAGVQEWVPRVVQHQTAVHRIPRAQQTVVYAPGQEGGNLRRYMEYDALKLPLAGANVPEGASAVEVEVTSGWRHGIKNGTLASDGTAGSYDAYKGTLTLTSGGTAAPQDGLVQALGFCKNGSVNHRSAGPKVHSLWFTLDPTVPVAQQTLTLTLPSDGATCPNLAVVAYRLGTLPEGAPAGLGRAAAAGHG